MCFPRVPKACTCPKVPWRCCSHQLLDHSHIANSKNKMHRVPLRRTFHLWRQKNGKKAPSIRSLAGEISRMKHNKTYATLNHPTSKVPQADSEKTHTRKKLNIVLSPTWRHRNVFQDNYILVRLISCMQHADKGT